MRALVVVMLLGRIASATPVETKCYAGTLTSSRDSTVISDGDTTKLVIERELDRDHGEVRSHRWMASHPADEIVVTWKLADDGKTFTWQRGSYGGKGTLDGKPWKWTAAHTDITIGHGSITTDETLAGTTLTEIVKGAIGTEPTEETKVEAKAFDCKDLKKQLAALDDTAPDAKHACYEGKDGNGTHLVIEQITEAKRVKIVTSTGNGNGGNLVLAIEGAKIFVKSPGKSWTGTGTITGKPGAWTGFEYTATIAGFDIRTEATLGGAKMTMKTTAQGPQVTRTTTREADAFDCKDLAAKRAALK